jgi:hypothetical protein
MSGSRAGCSSPGRLIVGSERVPCTTVDCHGTAERYVTREYEGAHPYCAECADLLIRIGWEEDRGPVEDPVVAERGAYRVLLERLVATADGRPDDPEWLEALYAARNVLRDDQAKEADR